MKEYIIQSGNIENPPKFSGLSAVTAQKLHHAMNQQPNDFIISILCINPLTSILQQYYFNTNVFAMKPPSIKLKSSRRSVTAGFIPMPHGGFSQQHIINNIRINQCLYQN